MAAIHQRSVLSTAEVHEKLRSAGDLIGQLDDDWTTAKADARDQDLHLDPGDIEETIHSNTADNAIKSKAKIEALQRETAAYHHAAGSHKAQLTDCVQDMEGLLAACPSRALAHEQVDEVRHALPGEITALIYDMMSKDTEFIEYLKAEKAQELGLRSAQPAPNHNRVQQAALEKSERECDDLRQRLDVCTASVQGLTAWKQQCLARHAAWKQEAEAREQRLKGQVAETVVEADAIQHRLDLAKSQHTAAMQLEQKKNALHEQDVKRLADRVRVLEQRLVDEQDRDEQLEQALARTADLQAQVRDLGAELQEREKQCVSLQTDLDMATHQDTRKGETVLKLTTERDEALRETVQAHQDHVKTMDKLQDERSAFGTEREEWEAERLRLQTALVDANQSIVHTQTALRLSRGQARCYLSERDSLQVRLANQQRRANALLTSLKRVRAQHKRLFRRSKQECRRRERQLRALHRSAEASSAALGQMCRSLFGFGQDDAWTATLRRLACTKMVPAEGPAVGMWTVAAWPQANKPATVLPSALPLNQPQHLPAAAVALRCMQGKSDAQLVLAYLGQMAQMLATTDKAPAVLLAEVLADMSQETVQRADSRVTLTDPIALAVVLAQYHVMDILRVRFRAESLRPCLAAVSDKLHSWSPELAQVTARLQATHNQREPNEREDRYVTLDSLVPVVLMDVHQNAVCIIHRARESMDVAAMRLLYTSPDGQKIYIPLGEIIY